MMRIESKRKHNAIHCEEITIRMASMGTRPLLWSQKKQFNRVLKKKKPRSKNKKKTNQFENSRNETNFSHSLWGDG